MVAGCHHFRAIAVTVTLFISCRRVRNYPLNFRRNVLHRATHAEVVGTARLPATVSLALDDLSAHVAATTAVLDVRLIQVQLCLDVMVINTSMVTALVVQSRHLNVLNLRLIDARTLAREELLLVVGKDTVLHLM